MGNYIENRGAFLNFLKNIGLDKEEYEYDFTGDILNQNVLDIDENMLKEIGIKKWGWRKRFLRNIKKLDNKQIDMINEYFEEKLMRENQTKIDLPEGAIYRTPYTIQSEWSGAGKKKKSKKRTIKKNNKTKKGGKSKKGKSKKSKTKSKSKKC